MRARQLLPPATLANESASPPATPASAPATLANESALPPATLANESPPATPPALVPASAPASPTSSLTSSRSTVSPQSAMGTVDKWGGFRAIHRGTAATQPSSNMEVEVVDLTNDTDEDFDQFKLSDDSSGSDTDDATDDEGEAPFGWPTSDMLAKAKKTRIEVKDQRCFFEWDSSIYQSIRWLSFDIEGVKYLVQKGGPTNIIDLGSGNGMLLAVSAMIRDLFQCKDFNVYGIEQCPMAVEASKKLLKGLQLSANVKCENLFYLKSLPKKGITHALIQSNGFNPALQFCTWELLSQQRDTIKVVAMGVGLANKEAAMYDFSTMKRN